jgi:hypothetical protein
MPEDPGLARIPPPADRAGKAAASIRGSARRRTTVLTRASRAALLKMTAALTGMAWLAPAVPAMAQNVGDVFRAVNPSVVVIRAKGSDVGASSGLARFTETVPPGESSR